MSTPEEAVAFAGAIADGDGEPGLAEAGELATADVHGIGGAGWVGELLKAKGGIGDEANAGDVRIVDGLKGELHREAGVAIGGESVLKGGEHALRHHWSEALSVALGERLVHRAVRVLRAVEECVGVEGGVEHRRGLRQQE